MTQAIAAVTLGVLGFLTVVGPNALQPGNIAWLGHGDPATHYLGWLFYRNSDWSFPIGLNPDYGLELASAIVFSDSHPLLAFLSKPLSPLLPGTFQYFGIWLLACFVLQAWFSYKLVGLLTDNPLVRALGAAFFVFAPPMVWRLHGHLSLVGHFFIVASLYLALAPSPGRRILAWAALLVASALTHAYLLAMVGVVWAADVVGRRIHGTLPSGRAALEFVVVLAATSLACWQAGYFSAGDGTIAEGFGFFRMNLLSMVDPSGWSRILPDIPEAPGSYEGFNYLGLGMIFLAICAAPILLRPDVEVVRRMTKRPVLVAAALGLTAFALSNNIGIGPFDFKVPIPDRLAQAANLFRCSGRLFWPVFYLVFFGIFFLLIRGYRVRVTISLMAIGLIVQIADTSKAWMDIRARLMTPPSSTWETRMTSPFWGEAATKYAKVRWLIPANETPRWREVANYAGTHGLATDAVYLARISNSALAEAQRQARAKLHAGTLEPDSLYMMGEGLLPHAAKAIDAQDDLLARIDGFAVVAPGWKRKCPTCPPVPGEAGLSSPSPGRLTIGERLLFGRDQGGSIYLREGWSLQEDWGVWTSGTDATIALPLESAQATAILVEAHALLAPSHPRQRVEIRINGIPANSVTLTAESGGRFEIEIPEAVRRQLAQQGLLTLQLHLPDAARPVDIGKGGDDRKLAIGLVALTAR